MDKGFVIFGSLFFAIIIFALISLVINLAFVKKIKKINSIKNLIFGLQITLIGILAFYVVYNFTFYSIFWSIAMYFIPVYLLITGFTIGLMGYLDNSSNSY